VVEPLAEASFENVDGLAPRLATSWEGSADGLTVTFKLREGVTWHDGKPFTSADVAFSALQHLEAAAESRPRRVQGSRGGRHAGRPHGDLPLRQADAVPADPQRAAGADQRGAEAHLRGHRHRGEPGQYGAGRHRAVPFAEHKPGEYYRLKRNEKAIGAQDSRCSTRSSTACCRTAPRRAGALEAEEIQLAAFSAVPLADLDRISKVPGIEVVTKGYEALTYQLVVEINHRRKELADLKVRQAIAHAIDKDFVVKTIFLGYAKRLDRAGAEERQAVLHRRRGRPMRSTSPRPTRCSTRPATPSARGRQALQLKLLPAPYFNETKQFGDYLRQALAEIGIDAELVNNDSAAHQKAVYTDHAFRPRGRAAGLPRRSGDLDDHPGAERHARRRAVLQPGRLRQRRARRPDRPRRPSHARRKSAHRALQGVPEARSLRTCR
jgi:peptide/nickel transport system substrate-binding protein